jgi:hypothetical protein
VEEAASCFIVTLHPAMEAPATCFIIAWHPAWRTPTPVTRKGTCGPGVARLWSAEKRSAAGRTRAEGHACFVV